MNYTNKYNIHIKLYDIINLDKVGEPMLYDLAYAFMIFIICSFFGWLMEILAVFISSGKIINRGFLIGPYCPIYGCGALIIVLFLFTHSKDPLNLYISFVLYASILEYFTSFIMEKIFGVRWWDYSGEKFNLNGRISLFTSLIFGFLGIIFVYLAGPALFNFLHNMNEQVLLIIALIIFIIFIVDLFITFIVVKKMKKSIKLVNKDITEDLNKQVAKFLENNHIVKAFPNIKKIVINLKK